MGPPRGTGDALQQGPVCALQKGLRVCRPLLWALLYTCVPSLIVIFQGEDLQPEEDEPAREQQPEDGDFLVGRDTDDRSELLETGTFQEGRTFFCF